MSSICLHKYVPSSNSAKRPGDGWCWYPVKNHSESHPCPYAHIVFNAYGEFIGYGCDNSSAEANPDVKNSYSLAYGYSAQCFTQEDYFKNIRRPLFESVLENVPQPFLLIRIWNRFFK